MDIKWGYKSINGDYVFSMVEKWCKKYREENPLAPFFNLGVGDVRFPLPISVFSAFKRASDEMKDESTFCGYGDERGFLPLRTLIKNYHKEKNENLDEDEIFITSGAKPALGEIMEIVSAKRALIFSPTYPLYGELCHVFNIEKVTYDENNDLFEVLRGLKGKNAVDIIFLCSPNNPTGKIFSLFELKILISYALENNSLILIDGAYASFCEDYPPVFSIPGSEKCVVEIRSYSKSISYTGLRCGYMLIKKENKLNNAYKKYLSIRSNGVNIVAQKGACAFYGDECQMEIKKRIEFYRKIAETLIKPFDKMGIKTAGGKYVPYLFCKVEKGDEFSKRLLFERGIATTPGRAFGDENSIRISCLGCNLSNSEKSAEIIEEFIS